MRTSPATVASFKPTLSTVSSIPGIDTGAPERTDTSSGRRSPPKDRPDMRSSSRRLPRNRSRKPSGSAPLAA